MCRPLLGVVAKSQINQLVGIGLLVVTVVEKEFIPGGNIHSCIQATRMPVHSTNCQGVRGRMCLFAAIESYLRSAEACYFRIQQSDGGIELP